MTTNVFEVESQIKKLLAEGKISALEELLTGIGTKEVVHVFAHITKKERLELLTLIPAELAATIVEEISHYQAANLIASMEAEAAAAILHEMHSDEQADLLLELEEEEAEAILSELEEEEAAEVRRLIEHDPETAGGLMSTEFITIPSDLSVEGAVSFLRKNIAEFSSYELKYVYVTDKKKQLLGVLQMQDLLLGKPEMPIANLIRKAEVVTVDTELAALFDFFEMHHYAGVPVVEASGEMAGVVLQRNLLELATEKQAIEHLETQGIVGGEELRSMPVWLRAKRRLSWLSVNIVLNMIAASVIAFYQETLTSVIALAVFLPIISDMSGCSGNQAVAVSMRELSIGRVRPEEIFRVWRQELSVGLINGLVLGILIAAAAWLWKGNPYLGLVAGGALAVNTLVAVSIGGTVPLLLKGFDIDPALASGPILTTITDMFGFFLALTFATILLPYLI